MPAVTRQSKSKQVPKPGGASSKSFGTKLSALKARLEEVADLRAASAVLNWDQATYMPKGGVSARGHQLATLARIAHDKFTAPEIGDLLESIAPELEGRDATDPDRALVRLTQRDYARATRLSADLVARISRHANAAYAAWTAARPANDFDAVAPLLETGVDLAREVSHALGGGAHPMDPLIERAEPGMTVRSVSALFEELRGPLVALVEKAKVTTPCEDACLRQHFPEPEQLAFGLKMAERFGFDLTRGRQDMSPHPFCTTFANGDVRITTRVKSDFLAEALYSTLHEAGHGMYEQGSAAAFDRSRLHGGTSPGVHESQSRLWENIVGRGEAFLTHAYPLLQKQFPKQLRRVPFKAFYRAVNFVTPSLIRTDADELTYNLHIMIRFDLECQLLDGRLKAKDLPAAWAEAYARDLGVAVTNHTDGCLQDVHWFSGIIGGAFQSYAIGNILAAQFYAAAVSKHPAIPAELEKGKFSTLHGWLRDNIYVHGRMFDPTDLVQRATGAPMSTEPYMAYLTRKYTALAEMRRAA